MKQNIRTYLLHCILLLLTIISTTLAGTWWVNSKLPLWTDYSWEDFILGLNYSIPLMLILSFHEFGHYFSSKYYNIKSSLPYYIPLPPFPGSIGTMGAIIKIKEKIHSKTIHFDIGIAGPIAGFVIALFFLIYGYANLPNLDYLFKVHPEYKEYGKNYADFVYKKDFQDKIFYQMYQEARKKDSINSLENNHEKEWSFYEYQTVETIPSISINKPLLMLFLECFISDNFLIPNSKEIMHYPILMAGFIALLMTALNLLPIGQLDGGHILYGMIGFERHKKVARWIFLMILVYAGMGLISPFQPIEDLIWNIPLYIGFLFFTLSGLKKEKLETLMYALIIFSIQFITPFVFSDIKGYSGWLLFCLILSRFLGIYHPKSIIEKPIGKTRKILGWIALIIFMISFNPSPITIK